MAIHFYVSNTAGKKAENIVCHISAALNSIFKTIVLFLGKSTVTDVHFGQNLCFIFSSWNHITPVGNAVLYQFSLDKAVHTARKIYSVAYRPR